MLPFFLTGLTLGLIWPETQPAYPPDRSNDEEPERPQEIFDALQTLPRHQPSYPEKLNRRMQQAYFLERRNFL